MSNSPSNGGARPGRREREERSIRGDIALLGEYVRAMPDRLAERLGRNDNSNGVPPIRQRLLDGQPGVPDNHVAVAPGSTAIAAFTPPPEHQRVNPVDELNQVYRDHERRINIMKREIDTLREERRKVGRQVTFLYIVIVTVAVALATVGYHFQSFNSNEIADENFELSKMKESFATTQALMKLKEQLDNLKNTTAHKASKADVDALHADSIGKINNIQGTIQKYHFNDAQNLMEKIKAENRRIDAARTSLDNKAATLQYQMGHADNQVGEILKDLADNKKVLQWLRNAKETLTKQVQQALGSAQDANDKAATLQDEVSEIQNALSENKEDLQGLRNTTETLTTQVQQALGNAQDANDKAVALQHQMAHAENQVGEVQKALSDNKKNLQSLDNAKETLTDQVQLALDNAQGVRDMVAGTCQMKAVDSDCPSGTTKHTLWHWYYPDSWDPWCPGSGDLDTNDAVDGNCYQDDDGHWKNVMFGCCS